MLEYVAIIGSYEYEGVNIINIRLSRVFQGLPRVLCSNGHAWYTSKGRHADQMPEPPQLTPYDANSKVSTPSSLKTSDFLTLSLNPATL